MRYLKMVIVLVVAVALESCSQGSKESEKHGHDSMESEGTHDDNAEPQEHGVTGEDHSGHDESAMSDIGTKTWSPSDDGTGSILTDFHFITGSIENINPEITQNKDGENVMKITGDGTPVAFVFHQSYGNIGMAVDLNAVGFSGTLKLIHHAQDANNHEYAGVNGSKMTLGRIVDGSEKVFDESDFDNSKAWINLRVSAAGTHYKGNLGSKNITHGHGDKMKDGYVGILLEGTGTVLIKSIEVVPLEDE